MNEQTDLGLGDDGATERVEEYRFKPPRRPIRGYPELWWAGKRPFTSTRYYPAQLKETHGEAVDGTQADGTPVKGWRNKLYWGDNLQVMSHLLKAFRGQVDLVYIDPPFDSKADYKKTVKLKGKQVENDHSAFEEKQYSDIWTNDEYLQFMMERLTLLRELLSDTGTIWLHCDWHKSHHLRCILDEVFGADNFRNDITWVRSTNPKGSQHRSNRFSVFTDTILVYAKSSSADIWADRARIPLTEEEIEEKYYREDEQGRYYDGPITRSSSMGPRPTLVYEYGGYTPPAWGWRMKRADIEALDEAGNLGWTKNGKPFRKLRPEDDKGKPIGDIWDDISLINSQADERVGYPTQKPEELLERILRVASDPGNLVLDSFMGSGTTGVVATRLGRRFIGADINLGAVQIASKRLHRLADELQTVQHSLGLDEDATEEDENGAEKTPTVFFPGFEVYNVNHYDVFRNPAQAKDLLLEALEVQPLAQSTLYDGEKDGRMVKVMPVNRLATKQDLNELLTGFDLKTFDKRKQAQPNRSVEKVTLVCMGHDPELKPTLVREVKQMGYAIDVEVVDILRDRADLQFKREAEAEVAVEDGYLEIGAFYPMNLLQKLSLLRENVEDWREMVESVMVDWNYDGAVLTPQVVDVPEGDELVSGRYKVPADAGTIRVKITDLLSESLELDVEA